MSHSHIRSHLSASVFDCVEIPAYPIARSRTSSPKASSPTPSSGRFAPAGCSPPILVKDLSLTGSTPHYSERTPRSNPSRDSGAGGNVAAASAHVKDGSPSSKAGLHVTPAPHSGSSRSAASTLVTPSPRFSPYPKRTVSSPSVRGSSLSMSSLSEDDDQYSFGNLRSSDEDSPLRSPTVRKASMRLGDDGDFTVDNSGPSTPAESTGRTRRPAKWIGKLNPVQINDIGSFTRDSWQPAVARPYYSAKLSRKFSKVGRQSDEMQLARKERKKIIRNSGKRELDSALKDGCINHGGVPRYVADMVERAFLAHLIMEKAKAESDILGCWQLQDTLKGDMDRDRIIRPTITLSKTHLYAGHFLPEYRSIPGLAGTTWGELQAQLNRINDRTWLRHKPNAADDTLQTRVSLASLAMRLHPKTSIAKIRECLEKLKCETSHMCHNPRCFRPTHVWPEMAWQNLGRVCAHKVTEILFGTSKVVCECVPAGEDRPPCINPKKEVAFQLVFAKGGRMLRVGDD